MDQQGPKRPSFFTKYKFTILSLLIIIVAAIPLLLLSNTAGTKKSNPNNAIATASPTPAPLTQSNADAQLSQQEANMQQVLDQMDKDLQSVANINSSQDSTSGL